MWLCSFVHFVTSLAKTKHLCNICTTSAQRLRCWSNIVQVLYKCFVFTGSVPVRGVWFNVKDFSPPLVRQQRPGVGVIGVDMFNTLGPCPEAGT